MVTSMSSPEIEAMLDSIDEYKLQTKIWGAIQKLQSIDSGVNSREPKFAKGEHVFIGKNEYLVNDCLNIDGHFVYQLAFSENPVLYIITLEGNIK